MTALWTETNLFLSSPPTHLPSQVEQAGTDEGEGYQNEASIQAAAAAMAAALQGGGAAGCGGSGDSRDSAQSPHHAKRRKGANGAIGSGDSDYEVGFAVGFVGTGFRSFRVFWGAQVKGFRVWGCSREGACWG